MATFVPGRVFVHVTKRAAVEKDPAPHLSASIHGKRPPLCPFI